MLAFTCKESGDEGVGGERKRGEGKMGDGSFAKGEGATLMRKREDCGVGRGGGSVR